MGSATEFVMPWSNEHAPTLRLDSTLVPCYLPDQMYSYASVTVVGYIYE